MPGSSLLLARPGQDYPPDGEIEMAKSWPSSARLVMLSCAVFWLVAIRSVMALLG